MSSNSVDKLLKKMEKTGFFPFQQYNKPSISAYEIKKLNENIDKLNELMKSLVLTSKPSNSSSNAVISDKKRSSMNSDKIKEYIELFDYKDAIPKEDSSTSITEKIKELTQLYDKKAVIPKRERSSPKPDKIQEVVELFEKKAVIPKRERSSTDSLFELVDLLQKVRMPKKKKQRAKEIEELQGNFDVMPLEGKRQRKRVNKYSDTKEEKRQKALQSKNKRAKK